MSKMPMKGVLLLEASDITKKILPEKSARPFSLLSETLNKPAIADSEGFFVGKSPLLSNRRFIQSFLRFFTAPEGHWLPWRQINGYDFAEDNLSESKPDFFPAQGIEKWASGYILYSHSTVAGGLLVMS